MVGFLKAWKVSGITTDGAKLTEPLYRLGCLLRDIDLYDDLSTSERAEYVALGHQYLVMKDAFDRFIHSGGGGRDDDAVKFLVMFAAVAIGMDGVDWNWQSVRHLSQGLYTSLDETPASFRAINIPLIQNIADRIDALNSAAL